MELLTDPTPDQRFTSPGFLLANIGETVSAWFDTELATIDLRPREAALLLVLRAEGPIGQQILGQRVGLDANSLVLALNSLESRELISRERDQADRRRHVVHITAAGRESRGRADAAVERVETRLTAGLTAEQVQQLTEVLVAVDVATGHPRGAD